MEIEDVTINTLLVTIYHQWLATKAMKVGQSILLHGLNLVEPPIGMVLRYWLALKLSLRMALHQCFPNLHKLPIYAHVVVWLTRKWIRLMTMNYLGRICEIGRSSFLKI